MTGVRAAVAVRSVDVRGTAVAAFVMALERRVVPGAFFSRRRAIRTAGVVW